MGERAITLGFTTFVLFQVFNVFNARAEQILRKHNATFQSAYRVGEIAPELCRYAGKIEADLIPLTIPMLTNA